ncbi:hypothetical protein DL96DRAFT_1604989 [Flagelloscypha sp. PMI_526]|nr:hypothetical protein DL96DRAFT_1604989 [Flagelloscypha sp. PMI_526]
MATPGILKWANDIRFAMINDPARQIFKENIDFLGFEYLENLDAQLNDILTGPSEDTLSARENDKSEDAMEVEPQRLPMSPSNRQDVLNSAILSPIKDENSYNAAEDSMADPTYPTLTDLSVIEEDEEMDKKRLSAPSEEPMSVEIPAERPHSLPREPSVTIEVPPSATAESFHTVPSSRSSRVGSPTETHRERDDIPYVSADPPNASRHEVSVPLARSTTPNTEVPVEDSPSEPVHKPSVASFPPPSPLPLRKSMRLPRDAESTQAVQTTVGSLVAPPKVNPFSKRTSWLKRAKEVKALDIWTVVQPIPSNPLKRKSSPSHDQSAPASAPLSEERSRKSLKLTKANGEPASHAHEQDEDEVDIDFAVPLDEPTGVFNQLRSTVARMGKDLGLSLGGTAAAQAFADARGSNEAYTTHDPSALSRENDMDVDSTARAPSTRSSNQDAPLSISDLVSTRESGSKPVFRPPSPPSDQEPKQPAAAQTPPPSKPIFTRPDKVFFPPEQPDHANEFSFQAPAFSRPAAMAVGLSPRLRSPSQQTRSTPAASQETQETQLSSDNLFDSGSRPTWLPSTQDTEYSILDEEQEKLNVQDLDDDDDSWPLPEPGAPPFRPRDDTWSTAPSGRTGDTGPLTINEPFAELEREVEEDEPMITIGNNSRTVPGGFENMGYDGDEDEDDDDIVPGSDDAVVLSSLKPTVGLVQPKTLSRTPSQTSMASSLAASQNQPLPQSGGLFTRAAGFMSNVLGATKKGKPEVKSIQLAAVAAKKQQEEKDKKDARLKEMEARRQAANQRKIDEEKARLLDAERKFKEDNERRKKEREQLTLKASTFKKDDDGKKRIDLQTKSTLKPPSKPLNASTSSLVQSSSKAVEKIAKPVPAPPLPPASKLKPKTPGKLPSVPESQSQSQQDDEGSQPSQLIRSQMAARALAKVHAAQPPKEVLPPTETIELPDIDSEYSDSDDSDRDEKKKALPDWAQSPELARALRTQSTMNPDEIFGRVQPLEMEKVFKSRTSRFRARTSSANWTGADRLTAEEEQEYARRMGFK